MSVILFVFTGLCISKSALAHVFIQTHWQNKQIGRQTGAGKMIALGRHETQK